MIPPLFDELLRAAGPAGYEGPVAAIVRRVIPYDLFAILLFNEKRKDLRIRYAVGHREEIVRTTSEGA